MILHMIIQMRTLIFVLLMGLCWTSLSSSLSRADEVLIRIDAIDSYSEYKEIKDSVLDILPDGASLVEFKIARGWAEWVARGLSLIHI